MKYPDGLILGITIGVMLVSALVVMFLLGESHVTTVVQTFFAFLP